MATARTAAATAGATGGGVTGQPAKAALQGHGGLGATVLRGRQLRVGDRVVVEGS